MTTRVIRRHGHVRRMTPEYTPPRGPVQAHDVLAPQRQVFPHAVVVVLHHVPQLLRVEPDYLTRVVAPVHRPRDADAEADAQCALQRDRRADRMRRGR